MHHPVSHTAAVTAAVSFLLLVCVIWLGAGVPRAARSATWWCTGLALALVLASSVATYFKPHGVWSVVPVVLSGAVLLGLLVAHTWGVVSRGDWSRAHQPAALFLAWVAWAGTKYAAWRKTRADAALPADRPAAGNQ